MVVGDANKYVPIPPVPFPTADIVFTAPLIKTDCPTTRAPDVTVVTIKLVPVDAPTVAI